MCLEICPLGALNTYSKSPLNSSIDSDSSEFLSEHYQPTFSSFVWVCKSLQQSLVLNFVTSVFLYEILVHDSFCIEKFCVLRRAFTKFATLLCVCVLFFCNLCVFELYWKFNLFRFFASTIRECRDRIAFWAKIQLLVVCLCVLFVRND